MQDDSWEQSNAKWGISHLIVISQDSPPAFRPPTQSRAAAEVSQTTSLKWAEVAHYGALRYDLFVRTELPVSFDFSLYLDRALREFIVELMEVSATSWLAAVPRT